jgi:hypothetical protein
MKKHLFISLFLIISFTGSAQWTNDPSVNTWVAGSDHFRTYPQISADPSGSYYVSNWESVSDTNVYYNFWLQLLDGEGNRVWGDDGIRISDNPSRSWISAYDLTTDSAGNAIIAFEDMRGGTGFSHVYLYAYDAAGHSVWDSGGIRADTGSFMSYSPTLAVTAKGNILVAWNAIYKENPLQEWGIRIMKYSPAGQPLWPQVIAWNEPDTTNMFATIIPVAEDDFILVWQRKFEQGVGIGYEWFTYLYAQRFDSAGHPVWPQIVPVCDHGDSAYVMPEFMIISTAKDENDGVYVSWFDDRYKTMYCNIYAQHVDINGNVGWIKNGVPVSPENWGYDRVEPHMVFDPPGQSLYLLWEEYRPQGIYLSFGLCGQKISAAGELKWGDLGKTFEDFEMDSIFYVNDLRLTPYHDLLFQYEQEYDSIVGPDTLRFDQLFISRVDTSGAFLWTPGRTLMAATNGTKFYPELSAYSNGIYVTTWAENRDSPFYPYGDIYAQNIGLNGKLGPMSIPSQAGKEGSVMISPNPSGSSAWLVFKNKPSGTVRIRIFNSIGQEIYSGTESPVQGSNLVRLDASGMKTGFYYVEVSLEGRVETVKWVVVI